MDSFDILALLVVVLVLLSVCGALGLLAFYLGGLLGLCLFVALLGIPLSFVAGAVACVFFSS